jgi:hypothetical protein
MIYTISFETSLKFCQYLGSVICIAIIIIDSFGEEPIHLDVICSKLYPYIVSSEFQS